VSRLGVWWGRTQVGVLDQLASASREYTFSYTRADSPISLSLPLSTEPFTPAQSRPFFEALLPEGAIRDRIASQLKLAASDSFGLLAALGRDCAGALQVLESARLSESPSVEWLDESELDRLIAELPRHPLGVEAGESRMRLSLAGVQNKAVLARDADGRFGRPLNGMPSTHILKPELPDADYPGLATNEFFCMSLARRCELPTASVELARLAGESCLLVERFDRDRTTWPPTRVHQEDLCQALGITPDFKYQQPGWSAPSYGALAELLNRHSELPGLDRLAAARAAVFHFLVGNADAHAKNISLIHQGGGVRLAPLYDVVSTAVYPELNQDLALAIGDEFDASSIGAMQWQDLAADFGLNSGQFARLRTQLVEQVSTTAEKLRVSAAAEGWHHPCIDAILETVAARTPQVSD
jgi:serine/threonine-protein kinase HipA